MKAVLTYKQIIEVQANRLYQDYKNGGDRHLYDPTDSEACVIIDWIYRGGKCRAEIGMDISAKLKLLINSNKSYPH